MRELLLSAGQTLVVTGSLTLTPAATASIVAPLTSAGPLIRVGGMAHLGGNLTIALSTDATAGTAVQVLAASNVTGAFAAISVRPQDPRLCLAGQPQTSTSTLGVLFSVDVQASSCTDSSPSRALSAAAIAGVALGATIVLLIALVLLGRWPGCRWANPFFRQRAAHGGLFEVGDDGKGYRQLEDT